MPVGFPATGWQLRNLALGAGDTLLECLSVETVATDAIALAALPQSSARRLTATRTLPAGVSTIRFSHDDGIRIYVDDVLVVDRWTEGAGADQSYRTTPLAAGAHRFTVEHFQHTGDGLLQLIVEAGCTSVPVLAGQWSLIYLALDSAGQLTTPCYAIDFVTSEMLSVSHSQAPASVSSIGAPYGYALLAGGVGNFRGRTDFHVSHTGATNVKIRGFTLYDTANASDTVTVPTYGTGAALLETLTRAPSNAMSISLTWNNVCDAAPAYPADGWDILYYRAVSGTSGYELDYNDCLGRETLAGLNVALDWAAGGPAAIDYLQLTDQFGAEFHGRRSYATNTTIQVTYDDGIEVSIDGSGTPLLSFWRPSGSWTRSFTMPAGTHDVRIRYFEATGNAALQFAPQ